MSQLQMVNDLFHAARKDENYVPRNHQTIGGMWTVDTWVHPTLGYKARLEDEGSTYHIQTETLSVSTTYGRDPQFWKGGPEELEALANQL